MSGYLYLIKFLCCIIFSSSRWCIFYGLIWVKQMSTFLYGVSHNLVNVSFVGKVCTLCGMIVVHFLCEQWSEMNAVSNHWCLRPSSPPLWIFQQGSGGLMVQLFDLRNYQRVGSFGCLRPSPRCELMVSILTQLARWKSFVWGNLKGFSVLEFPFLRTIIIKIPH